MKQDVDEPLIDQAEDIQVYEELLQLRDNLKLKMDAKVTKYNNTVTLTSRLDTMLAKSLKKKVSMLSEEEIAKRKIAKKF